MSELRQKMAGIFYLAKAEIEDFAKAQPGEYLVCTNDVQEVLNTAEDRVWKALGIPTDEDSE